MALLSYEKIFSRVRNKSYDPKELFLNDDDLNEINAERLHSAVGNVRIRRLFSTLSCDDQAEELTWVLKNAIFTSTDEDEEEDFVVELLALGVVIEWLKPQVDSVTNISKAIGGKEEKSINNEYKAAIDRLKGLEVQLAKMIRDHGYLYNSYLQG